MIPKTVLVLAFGLFTIPAFAETETPYKQFQNGTPLEQIQCRDSKILLESPRGTPACVNENSLQKIQQRGWATIDTLDHADILTSHDFDLKDTEIQSPINMITTGNLDNHNNVGESGFSFSPPYSLTFPEQVRVGDQFDIVLDYTFIIPSVEIDENGLEILDYTNPAKVCAVECMGVLSNMNSQFHIERNSYVDLVGKDNYELLGIGNDTYYLPIREFEHHLMVPIYNNTHPQQKTFSFTINEPDTEYPLGEIRIDFNYDGYGRIYFLVNPDNTISLSDERIVFDGMPLLAFNDPEPSEQTARATVQEPYDLIPREGWDGFAEYLRLIEGEIDSYYGFLQSQIETGAVNKEWIDSFFESYPEFDDRLKSQLFTPSFNFLLPSAYAQIPSLSFVYGDAYYYDVDNELIPILSNTSQLMPGIQTQDSYHSSFHI